MCSSGRTTSDGKSCANDTRFVVIGGGRKISFTAVSPLDRPPPYSAIIRGLRSVTALDIDYEMQRVYFVEGKRRQIRSMFLNGTGMTSPLVSGELRGLSLRFLCTTIWSINKLVRF